MYDCARLLLCILVQQVPGTYWHHQATQEQNNNIEHDQWSSFFLVHQAFHFSLCCWSNCVTIVSLMLVTTALKYALRRTTRKICIRHYTHERTLIHTEQLSSKSSQQDIADALRPHFERQSPVLLKFPNSDCDAVRCWKSLDYLRMTVGDDAPSLYS